MDLELTEEQRTFAQAACDYAQGELVPNAARWDAAGIFPREAFAQAGELSFWAIYADEAIGGLGLPRQMPRWCSRKWRPWIPRRRRS